MDKMGDSAAPDQRAMSLHLARALDEIGLNTLTVKKRRHKFLCEEQHCNVYHSLKGHDTTHYHFGSQTEGTTTPGLHSDIDTLVCTNDIINVIEDMADWTPGKHNLLMLQEDTAPGYCRLQFSFEGKGMVMKNTLFHSGFANHFNLSTVRNGPAQTLHDGVDFVIALKYNHWPCQAQEFIRRRRRYGWPSQQLLEEATSHGVFLVPIGYKLSPTELIEWRISASLAERHLMFSLKIVHIKCYVVLKILMKSFIEPCVKKCISSYHCKTALLYCTENTEPGFWREENLLSCVIKCMEMLRNWVADLFCPQFIIKEENLFAGKVTAVNRNKILAILNYMIGSDGHVLLRVTTDGLGQKLQAKINTEPSPVALMDSLASIKLVAWFVSDMQSDLDSKNVLYITKLLNNSGAHASVIRTVYRDIVKLQGMLEGAYSKHERKAIKSFITFLSRWLGSLLASYSLAHNKRVPRIAMQLICTAAKYDVSSMLKLASISYCNGRIIKAGTLLHAVEDIFWRHLLKKVCRCCKHEHGEHSEFYHNMYALTNKKSHTRFFDRCIRFSRHEKHCIPQGLHNELRRAVRDDMRYRHLYKDNWMDLAVVDCRPFLYYLQYLTYGQLGMREIQQQSLRNLDWCAREDKTLTHRETAWNLLGQCWEIEQKSDVAKDSYLASLEIRPRNNAANRHLRKLGVAPAPLLVRRRLKTAGKILLVTSLLLLLVLMIQSGTGPLLSLLLIVIMKKFSRFLEV